MRLLRKQLYVLIGDLFILALLLIFLTQLFAYPTYLAKIPGRDYLFLAAIPLIWAIIIFLQEGYSVAFPRQYVKGLRMLGQTAVLATLAVGFIVFILPGSPEFSRRVLLSYGVVAVALLFSWRMVFGLMVRVPALRENVLVFGTGPLAAEVAKIILPEAQISYSFEGFVAASPDELPAVSGKVILFREIGEVLRQKRIHLIVIAADGALPAGQVRFLTVARRRGIRLVRSHDIYEELTGRFPVGWMSPEEMAFFEAQSYTLGRAVFERAVSFLVGSVALLVSLALWPFIILAQQLTSRGPVFYVSTRVGRHGKTFDCFKFRSMVPDAERHTGVTWTKKDDPRITASGRWMRKTHLDELPQLINVILGHMNLIGPRAERPELAEELNEKIPYYEERFLVKPGITGWAQVSNVFSSASVEDSKEKLEYDLYYIKNRTFALDLLIVLETVKIMLWGRGV
ncbi:sugar transferase [Candidatus Parcubacteria bacterium]|nr:sugar transferase [Candidatus Parcubacteria bacterium]